MAGDTPITIVGNLVEDPILRFTPAGAAVANFRIASTPRVYNRDTGQYEDGEALFLTCNVWRQAAENVAESLTKGMRVIVNGRLKQRSYQTKEGEQRTVFEIEVDEVGPSLKFASAQVNRNPRGGSTPYQGGQGGYQAQQGGFGQQVPPPRQTAEQARAIADTYTPQTDPWGQPAQTPADDDQAPF